MKKILIILSSLIILGCGEKVETKSYFEKKELVNLAIIENNDIYTKEMNRIMTKLKEQMKNSKLKDEATKEYNGWNEAIEDAEKEKIRIAEKKKQKFLEEISFLLIKNQLREPSSYELDFITYTQNNDIYDISHHYRAKNGFGGYSKGKEFLSIEITQKDFEEDPNYLYTKIIFKKNDELLKKLKNFKISD